MNSMFDEEILILDESDDVDFLIEKCFHHIAVIDDDESVIHSTIFTLKNLIINGCNLKFYSARTARAGFDIIKNNPQIKLALIDVVMETDTAGLDLVKRIRNEIPNRRIILIIRSGQPGNTSELALLADDDIDDYIHKAHATYQLMVSTLKKWITKYDDM